jgi:hypothetical protein
MKLKILAIISLNLLVQSAFGESLEMHKLNPSLRQHIDPNIQSSVENGINTDLTDKNNKFNDVFGKTNEANGFVDSMKNIEPNNFTNEGLKERDKEHNTVVKSIIENPNIHKLEANDPVFSIYDEITKDPTKYISDDCKQIIGETKGPAWKELKVKKKIVNTEYEQNLCESLQNQYSCKKTLNLHCRNLSAQAAPKLDVTNVTGISPLISNSFGGGIWTFRWAGGPNKGRSPLYGTNFDFTIDDVNAVHSFVLEEIWFDDFILVKINDTTVYSGPYERDILKLFEGTWGDFKDRRKNNMAGYLLSKEKKITWWRRLPHVNLAPYLRNGANTLSIRVGQGWGLDARIKYNLKACAPNDWVENWEETCTHIAVP